MQNIYHNFFEPVGFYGVIHNEAYQSIYHGCIDALEAMARANNLSIYVIDYYKQNFLYVSSDFMFLNGHTVDEIKEMGYAYYTNFVPVEDLRFLKLINKKGFEFFYQTPPEDRLKYSISYDFYITDIKHKKKTLVNHKLTPIKLNSRNQVWLAICVISPVHQKTYGEVVIHKSDSNQIHVFDRFLQQWFQMEKLVFSDVDLEILKLSALGYSNSGIAEKMYYDENTIKYHKKQIFARMKVKNITEAVVYAMGHKII